MRSLISDGSALFIGRALIVDASKLYKTIIRSDHNWCTAETGTLLNYSHSQIPLISSATYRTQAQSYSKRNKLTRAPTKTSPSNPGFFFFPSTPPTFRLNSVLRRGAARAYSTPSVNHGDGFAYFDVHTSLQIAKLKIQSGASSLCTPPPLFLSRASFCAAFPGSDVIK